MTGSWPLMMQRPQFAWVNHTMQNVCGFYCQPHAVHTDPRSFKHFVGQCFSTHGLNHLPKLKSSKG